MLHAKRSLVIKVASAVSTLAMIAAVTAVAVTRSPSTASAASAFKGTQMHLTQKSATQSNRLVGNGATTQAATRANTAQTKTFSRKEFNVSKQAPSKSNAMAPRVNAPSVRLGPQIAPKIGSATNFDGLANIDNDALNGFEVTPPDQGLCAAPDPGLGGQNVVLEMVNMAIAEYDTNGNLIGENNLNNFFLDPYAYGDVRCVYDAQAHAVYFTELSLEGFFDSSNIFGADLLAVDTNTGNRSEYFVDWSDNANSGCPCLGDQMRVGYDNSGIYLTADEFPLNGPGVFNEGYNGSEMYVIDKEDVLSNVALPTAYYYNTLTVSGIPVLGLMPAQSQTFAGSEWLANTFPYTADGNNNSVSHSIALWRAVGDNNLNSSPPTISVSVASTETYAYPVTAVTTTGSFTSIDAGDDRIGQLEFNNNHLYTTATTAVNVSGDPNTYDGAAWFDFNTVSRSVSHQGYLAFKGYYVVYPSIIRTHAGASYITYTITSAGLNPSAAFSNRPTDTYPFNNPQMAAYGVTPHFDFAYRWGDYSAACIDTNGTNVWMATEYIPALARQGFFANWGTRVTSR